MIAVSEKEESRRKDDDEAVTEEEYFFYDARFDLNHIRGVRVN